MSIRVLLVDDHKILREGLRALLEKQPDMEVIAEAENGLMALRLVQEMLPNVVIMDVAMPDLNGIEATHQVIAKAPGTKVVALSMYSDKRFVMQMLAAGASAYLPKDCAFEEVAQAIHAVVAGRTYLSPTIVDVVVKDQVHHFKKIGSSVFSVLSSRERQVLQLLAEGKSAKEIANHLGLSVKTIDTYRQQIMNKLDLHSMAELIKYAIREGLTSVET